jgi:hypothetical protein
MNSPDQKDIEKQATNGDGEPIEEGDRSRAEQIQRPNGDGQGDDPAPLTDQNSGA